MFFRQKKSNYIVLFDPAMKSDNLGDYIITEASLKLLNGLFPSSEIIKIPMHGGYGSREINLVKDSKYTFIGGTNILINDINRIDRFIPEGKKILNLVFPSISKTILLGCGWSHYEESKLNFITKRYYNGVLNSNLIHSVRDSYTANKLKYLGIGNVKHTSCHTTWNLDVQFKNLFNTSIQNLLFTLTDYAPNIIYDELLLKNIFELSSDYLYFFPQGKNDLAYLKSLDIYKKNKDKVHLLPYDFNFFNDFIRSVSLNYIGTRLHAGIFSLQYKHPALIIGIDNRATEISKDIELNVIPRHQSYKLIEWAENSYVAPFLKIPYNNISEWKSQFFEN